MADNWRLADRRESPVKLHLTGVSGEVVADVKREGEEFVVALAGATDRLALAGQDGGRFLFALNGALERAYAVRHKNDLFIHIRGCSYRLRVTDPDAARGEVAGGTDLSVTAPMPGTIVKLLVAAGVSVTRGQPLAIVESMKMENEVRAPADAVVARLLVTPGEQVGFGQQLVELVLADAVSGQAVAG